MDFDTAIAGAVVAGIGLLLALLETSSRYRARVHWWLCRWVWIYVFFSILGSITAYALLRLSWRPGFRSDAGAQITQIITAGAASWTGLRSPLRAQGSTVFDTSTVGRLAGLVRPILTIADTQVKEVDLSR